jgi:RND family efflux transporter MFP subunit
MRTTLLVAGALAVLAAVAVGGWLLGQRGTGAAISPPGGQATALGASAGSNTTASGADALRRERVVSLGRIRPRTRVRVAGPARPSVVVGRLLADQGDQVQAGQEIALLDSVPTEEAEVAVARVEVADAQRELARARNLHAQGVTARAVLDQAQSRAERAAARLTQARAELERSHVRAPISGVVLEVFARDGERVGAEGILELADTATMLAVAEVSEAEIAGIRVGQSARVTSPTLPGGGIGGRVSRIAAKVRQQEVVSADPVANLDARVVEVEVEVDDPAAVAGLTNLRVEVEIDLAGPPAG